MQVAGPRTARADVRELSAELHARLRAFVARRVADPFAADDLAQDILMRIHRRMDGLKDGERLDAWAYQIARNAIIDHYRAQAARAETSALDVAPPQADLGPIDDLAEDAADVRSELAGCLAPLVERLPEPYRQAIELTDLGPLTQAAAAERLQLSVPGVKARVQRGRSKLRAMLLDCCEVAMDSRGAPTGYRRLGACGCARRDGADCGCT